MTKDKLLNILAEFFENNTNIIERFIKDSIIPNTTIESFIDEIRNDTEGTPEWILSEGVCRNRLGLRSFCPIKYIEEDQDSDIEIFTYNEEKFRVIGIYEGEPLTDVYTVEYKEIPVIIKQWIRI